jgi:cation transport regulator ChaC
VVVATPIEEPAGCRITSSGASRWSLQQSASWRTSLGQVGRHLALDALGHRGAAELEQLAGGPVVGVVLQLVREHGGAAPRRSAG